MNFNIYIEGTDNMDFFNSKLFKISIIITSFILGVTLSIIVVNNKYKSKDKEVDIISGIIEEKEEPIIVQDEKIYVDIKGAVKSPGVYELENNSKVIDAINIAGGLNKNANTKYINLSKKLSNETVLYIYTNNEINKITSNNIKIEETCNCEKELINECIDSGSSIITNKNNIPNINNTTPKEEVINNNDKEDINTLININTADQSKLTTLTGIGDAKAKAIIEYRNKNGNFKTIEDIKQVSGISDSIYEKIKDYITV